MADTESRVFKIVALIVTFIIAIISLIAIIFFSEIYGGNTISQGEALTMIITFVIVGIISASLFIWAVFRLIINKETRKEWTAGAKRSVSDWAKSTDGGYTQTELDSAKAKIRDKYYSAKQKLSESRGVHALSSEPPASAKNKSLAANA